MPVSHSKTTRLDWLVQFTASKRPAFSQHLASYCVRTRSRRWQDVAHGIVESHLLRTALAYTSCSARQKRVGRLASLVALGGSPWIKLAQIVVQDAPSRPYDNLHMHTIRIRASRMSDPAQDESLGKD